MVKEALKTIATKENLVKVGKVAVGIAAGVAGCKVIDIAKEKSKAKKILKAAKKAEEEKAKEFVKANANHSEVYYDLEEACEVIEDDGKWAEAWAEAYAEKKEVVTDEGH